ncbi:hypothetical protein MSHI_30530 [Mycobacterium shinjukuense]|uniref:Uncharacterized protein n=1 Tax=Mycobacterium shinjukuense TaxID=398694 RepID=A0A7I7MTI5_9MYCO|nr:hypothetical protein MSHI_30530 [Mycobacterium shinjukuense]
MNLSRKPARHPYHCNRFVCQIPLMHIPLAISAGTGVNRTPADNALNQIRRARVIPNGQIRHAMSKRLGEVPWNRQHIG